MVAKAMINEKLKILHLNIAAKRESFNIPHSTFNICKAYEERDLETDYSDRDNDPHSN